MAPKNHRITRLGKLKKPDRKPKTRRDQLPSRSGRSSFIAEPAADSKAANAGKWRVSSDAVVVVKDWQAKLLPLDQAKKSFDLYKPEEISFSAGDMGRITKTSEPARPGSETTNFARSRQPGLPQVRERRSCPGRCIEGSSPGFNHFNKEGFVKALRTVSGTPFRLLTSSFQSQDSLHDHGSFILRNSIENSSKLLLARSGKLGGCSSPFSREPN